MLDAGYDAPRIAHLLAGLPVEILGRLRSDRVMRRPTPSREEFQLAHPKGGRPPKHGGEFVFGEPTTWGTEQAVTVTDTRLYGKATAQAWDRLHPRLTRRAAWLDHDGPLPIIKGTVIRLLVEKLPSGEVNKPVWLWWSRTGATEADVDRCWQSFLRRFDIEHTFRLFKQTLGLDQAPAPQLGSGRPVDLTRDRRIRPASTRPTAGHRPPQALGEADRAEQTDTRARPQRVQEPAREDRLSSRRTETVPPWPWQTARLEEPPPRHPARRQSSRHRRGLRPPRPPQGGHQTATRRMNRQLKASEH